ncbi:nuclear elongation and deformation protein 1 [Cordyceps militaris CM01]|uniref:Nuclear elongation and deformation protein 1 n=1 Tax=Cordyceps militaris (strain CM01) TaxID=983644 RepID=G3JJM9_CORMM|nr:nuclear elongation and deformation protein 1 [Cordyceps militaris CM01]EGX91269.1 nuclear elongation and deformation protein 1 [Cordyceps militaris CM01]
MQYVRNISDSVSTAWNSINPATLSGAIDVIVVEHQDGTLACSPFHVRFGKFSLLRPYEKKVEFRVNGSKQEYSMKLGEGGEAFFVFETTENIPESMQTSPLVSPASSPPLGPNESVSQLGVPDQFELDGDGAHARRGSDGQLDENGYPTPASSPLNLSNPRPASGDWSAALTRPRSDDALRHSARTVDQEISLAAEPGSERSESPDPVNIQEAIDRAMTLSRGLSAVNIPSQVTETGDLMLDMTGFRSSEEEMLRAEIQARKILSEELDGNYDIGALFGFDEEGNLWIYSSESAKKAAMNKTIESSLQAHRHGVAADALSDPGYQSDVSDVTSSPRVPTHRRSESDAGPAGLATPPRTPADAGVGNPNRNYAKTLRLTSDQLKKLGLKSGENPMGFTVNRATCTANMYLWKYDTPVVISDIDGTITKSDALGHVLNMIGRDWTHAGIAKLYSDIALNGFNIMYLTSRSVGQADTTRAYLNNIVQEGCRMPHGPTILSPDRTMAALRREVYLRKPHVFKMATLRDIANLYGPDRTPFYAGFGNRLTDQISYRTVDVPRNRIFTINSNSEVSLDLLSLNKLKMTYVHINEVVDHYFPSVSTLVMGGGEDYTDFKYWRDTPLELDEFSASDSDDIDDGVEEGSEYTDGEDGEDGEDLDERLGDSYISQASGDDLNSRLAASMTQSQMEEELGGQFYANEEDLLDDEGDDEGDDDVDEENIVKKNAANLEEDYAAEIITGVGHLSMDKKEGEGIALDIENSAPQVLEPVEIRFLSN